MNTKPFIVSEIRRLSQEEGLKDSEIAEIMNYNRISVQRIRRDNNIPTYNAESRKNNKNKSLEQSKILYSKELELAIKLSNKDETIKLLKKENEKLKREIEAVYNIDYETSDVPKLKRRIYDLEEICDNLKKSLVLITNQLSTVRYSEYENTGE